MGSSPSATDELRPSHPCLRVPLVRMRHEIDDHRCRQDEHVVLLLLDVHSVGVCQSEPLLAHSSDDAAAPLEGVFVIEKVPVCLEIVRPGHVHREPGPERSEQVFLHDGDGVAAAHDFVLRSYAEELLIDPHKLDAASIQDRELVAKAEDFAVDVIDLLAVSIFDAEVIAPGQNPLPHDVTHDIAPSAAPARLRLWYSICGTVAEPQ